MDFFEFKMKVVLHVLLVLSLTVLVQCHTDPSDITQMRSRRMQTQAKIQLWNKQFNSSNKADGLDAATLYGMAKPMSPMDVTQAELGYIMMQVIDEMISMKSNFKDFSELKQSDLYAEGFRLIVGDLCHRETTCSTEVTSSPYRTIDGSCNNLQNPRWGMSVRPQARLLPPSYDDGFGSPRNRSIDGSPLLSTRVISNTLHKPDLENERDSNATVMVMSFGQFLDHDLVKTPVTLALDGTAINCCGEGMGDGTGPLETCLPIKIPTNKDPHFKKTGQSCMHFVRSVPAPCEGCEPCQRQQINSLTSYIDASNVYGSTIAVSRQLRTFEKGMLQLNDGDMLPESPQSNVCTLTHASQYCLHAGDSRVNTVPNLSSSHILFARAHNKIAERLSQQNPTWSDEKLYQETRKIIGAIMQHIVYNEYLPVVLGDKIMRQYELNVSDDVYNDVYDETVDATVTNSFGAAAFRFGHTTIPNKQRQSDQDFNMTVSFPIEYTYHNPNMSFQNADGVTRWLVSHQAIKTNGFFEKGVRDLLFLAKGKSLDLPAINLQRGRDHGVPPYNKYRQLCHLDIVTEAEFQLPGTPMGDFNTRTADAFREAYSNADDIDLFAGGVSEHLLEGAQVGPLFACMLGSEFRRLKIGDRFYFENPPFNGRPGFTQEQLKSIKQITLAKLVCEHNNAPRIQKNVFRPACSKNPLVKCDDLPDIDIAKWVGQ